jgi:hypothetical protein
MKKVIVILSGTLAMLFSSVSSFAQCAMCRATLETNVSNGSETILASSLNFGILYLFSAPYLIIAAVGFLWYRNSRKNINTY